MGEPRYWCSTKVNGAGEHVSGNWGWCDENCVKGAYTIKKVNDLRNFVQLFYILKFKYMLYSEYILGKGEFGDWGRWSKCSKDCKGTKTRRRTCSMDQCEGSGSETVNCNEHCSENY